jgi:hypothetical protein
MLIEEPAKAGFVQIAFPPHFPAKASHACLADQEAAQEIVDVPSHGASFRRGAFHFMRVIDDGEGLEGSSSRGRL